MQLKIARARAGRPARSTTLTARARSSGSGEPAERQPVGPVDLAARVVAGLALEPSGERVGEVQHQGIVHQRQGLERRGRDGPPRRRGRWVGAVEGVEQVASAAASQARKSVRRFEPGRSGSMLV